MKKSKKPTKKSTKKQPARRAKRTASRVLTPGERQVLLKPPSNYDDIIAKFLTAWSEKRELRIPKLTRARLAAMLHKALSARDRENAVTIRLEEQRHRVADARLVAEHAAWSALLAANSAVKAHARVDPALADAFAFLTEALRYAPRDAVTYAPQTTLAGVLAKDTGEEPFDSPKALLEAAKTRTAGYVDPELGDVPVNYLSTVDTTGGNSGSPTLNAKGELCGLLFDGNYEGMAGDYFVDDAISRSIHADTQYMLWVMDAVDGAHNLLREMNVPVKYE